MKLLLKSITIIIINYKKLHLNYFLNFLNLIIITIIFILLARLK